MTDVPANLDDRKTAVLASWTPQPPLVPGPEGSLHIHSHAAARAVLRADEVTQSGFGADVLQKVRRTLIRLPVLFLDGQEHQEMRRATARFFTPRTVEESYVALMEAETKRLVDQLKRDKTARLDLMSMDMAVAVAGAIVGLTEHLIPGMAGRIAALLDKPPIDGKLSPGAIVRIILSNIRITAFYICDVLPSIRTRRKAPQSDVISHLLSLGYSNAEIVTECVIFGAAGMVTTREFIAIAALHFIDRPQLRERFLAAGMPERRAILEEILRLEPVVGKLYRRAKEPLDLPGGHRVDTGQRLAIDVRSANGDEAAVGACPFHIDPDRKMPDPRTGAPAMSFGDGRHRCPGAFIAMEESAIFLAALLALPGLRVVGEPKISWNDLVGGYQFDECHIAID